MLSHPQGYVVSWPSATWHVKETDTAMNLRAQATSPVGMQRERPTGIILSIGTQIMFSIPTCRPALIVALIGPGPL